MKTLLLLLSLSVAAFAQDKLPDANMKDISLFPQSHVNQSLRAKHVLLGDMQQIKTPTQYLYFIDVDVPNVVSFYNTGADNVTFVMNEAFAKKLSSYYSGTETWHAANITFTVVKLDTAFYAKLTCIEPTGIFGKKFERIGDC